MFITGAFSFTLSFNDVGIVLINKQLKIKRGHESPPYFLVSRKDAVGKKEMLLNFAAVFDNSVCVCVCVVCVETGDGRVCVWDAALPGRFSLLCGDQGGRDQGGGEVLACEWSKYDKHTLITAGTDATVK